MQHIRLVEAVVAEFIVDYLIGREIIHHIRVKALQLFGSQEEYRLGERTAMESIFGIAYGTDRHHYLHIRTSLTQQTNCFCEVLHTRIHGEFLLTEQLVGAFLAVVHNLTCLLQHIHMVGAEREESHLWWFITLLKPTLHGVINAGWVIHHPKRIDHGTEFLINEPLTDAVGKTGSDKQHPLKRRDTKGWDGDIDYSAKNHF